MLWTAKLASGVVVGVVAVLHHSLISNNVRLWFEVNLLTSLRLKISGAYEMVFHQGRIIVDLADIG